VVFVVFGLRHMMRPLEELVAAAREVASGRFGRVIAVRSRDEIGELTREFNSMSAQLQQSYAYLEDRVAVRTRELSTVNAIATAASESLDRAAVLDRTTEELQNALALDAVEIRVVDERRGELVVAASRGIRHGSHQPGGRVPLAECMCGGIAMGGEPIVINELNEASGLVPVTCRSEGLRSLAMIPLRSRDRSAGVLFAASAEPGAFGEPAHRRRAGERRAVPPGDTPRGGDAAPELGRPAVEPLAVDRPAAGIGAGGPGRVRLRRLGGVLPGPGGWRPRAGRRWRRPRHGCAAQAGR
jgi:HAMP domain-containing protein